MPRPRNIERGRPMAGKRKDVYLVVGGKYHDFDFARLELLKLLAEHDVIRVKVANDYSDVDGMATWFGALITSSKLEVSRIGGMKLGPMPASGWPAASPPVGSGDAAG